MARLVEAAAYHVWALWLVVPGQQGRVVVVDAPYDIRVDRGQFVADRELVRRLRSVRPITGVRPG